MVGKLTDIFIVLDQIFEGLLYLGIPVCPDPEQMSSWMQKFQSIHVSWMWTSFLSQACVFSSYQLIVVTKDLESRALCVHQGYFWPVLVLELTG